MFDFLKKFFKGDDSPPVWQRGNDPDEYENVPGLWLVLFCILAFIGILLINY